MDSPLLSVCIITYQHVNFIRECIDSVLSQKTDFPFEIIIGEDGSTDGTREICREYAGRYPDKIRLFLRSREDVIYIEGAPTGKFNFTECNRSARGKYFSICEGDDYWSDPYKLQQQVRFLESHPECAGCFHNVEERYEDDDSRASFLYCDFPAARKISFDDLAYTNLIPTCSVVYRTRLFGDFPQWYMKVRMGDWPLHLLNAQFGDYWYIPKVMGVHRLHKMSAWMLQNAERNNKYVEDAYEVMIREFAGNPQYVTSLLAGKKEFLEGIRQAKKAAGMKAKVKDLVIRQIRKL